MNKHSFSATLLVALFVISLVLSPFSGVFAANGDHITTPYNINNPFTTQTTTAGQLLEVSLANCFNEPNSGHALTYSCSGNNIGPHTHVGYNNNNVPTLYFTVQNAGNYTVTITATCSAGDSASFDIPITVGSAAPASSAQVSYDETNASSVTVHVTVSNDGMPILGNDSANTELACVEVTVPYFDLALYGLSNYYRYPAAGGNTVIQRPTLLHLYIYLLERYYMNRPAASCGTGYTNTYNIFTDTTAKQIYYIDGEEAYYNDGTYHPLSYEGGPGSLYMTSFWGHNFNLMYYRNHVYPLMSAGWGATADYILLSDGDYIDIAMFSNMDFFWAGAFLCFNSDEFVAQVGVESEFDTMMFPTSPYFGYSGELTEMDDELKVEIYDEGWESVGELEYTDSNAYYYEFEDDGTYYIVARDINAESSSAYYAPAVAIVTVNP